jgi:hypothetical protein
MTKAIPGLGLRTFPGGTFSGQWSSLAVTYSFETFVTVSGWTNPMLPNAVVGTPGFTPNPGIYFSQLSLVFAETSSLTKLKVTNSSSTGAPRSGNIEVSFGSEPTNAFGEGTFPSQTGLADGGLMLNSQYINGTGAFHWNDFVETAFHELGHSLGLTHPFNSGANIVGSRTLPTVLELDGLFTVMTYTFAGFDRSGINTKEGFKHWMLYDVAELQTIYGAETGYHGGADTYTWMFAPTDSFGATDERNLGEARCIWDGAGIDTFDLSSAPAGQGSSTDGVLINIGQGQFSA